MDISMIMGVLLIAAGALALVNGANTTEIGPLQMSITEKESVSVPVWAGIGTILIGGVLLLPTRKS